ncbi:hypothetical protein [Magnetospirillum moscoviense]|uniref:Uncharacterized protein n=1 Tax=Magnetospirillum moscoviense TaxID=1437059 RepID=A0A178MYG1_9PROT|nr:hypothetical protein [Magnetospirillum moscoviense]OAN55067.1 hypothetical protein A6A05_00465 [Magnetospirillum moscoviense]
MQDLRSTLLAQWPIRFGRRRIAARPAHRPFRRFGLAFLTLAMGVTIIGATMNTIFMWRLNEFWSLDQLIASQAKGAPILYNGLTIEKENNSSFKRHVLAMAAPEVIAIGSSRSFPVRDYMFRTKFYNFGGRFGRSTNFPLADLDIKKQEILAQPSIRVVLLFLDYFWFMTDVPIGQAATPVTTVRHAPKNRGIALAGDGLLAHWLRAVALPRALIRDGVLTWTQYFDVIRGRYPTRRGPIEAVGYSAVLNGSGIAQDGSYYYLWLKAIDDKAETTCSYLGDFPAKQRLPHGAYRPDQKLDPAKVAAFKAFVDSLATASVHVVPILPPLPPSMIDRMTGDPSYAFVDQWRTAMHATFPSVFDFHDIRSLGATECEFMDDVHGQDVAYMRMFRAMAEREPDLARLFDQPLMDQLIGTFAGRRLVTSHGLGQAVR